MKRSDRLALASVGPHNSRALLAAGVIDDTTLSQQKYCHALMSTPVARLLFAAAAVLVEPAAADCKLNDWQEITSRIAIVQVVIGTVSILGCLAVLAVIYGYNRDRRSLRDRILLGMFGSNLIFSLFYVIPTSFNSSSGRANAGSDECSNPSIFSEPTIRVARSTISW